MPILPLLLAIFFGLVFSALAYWARTRASNTVNTVLSRVVQWEVIVVVSPIFWLPWIFVNGSANLSRALAMEGLWNLWTFVSAIGWYAYFSTRPKNRATTRERI